MSYSIKTVAEMTGIPRNTLLAWERRYDLLEPRRSDNGYRIYSDDDVDLLKRVKALVDDGHRISEAVRLVNRNPLGKAREAGADSADTVAKEIREALEDRLLAFDRAGAEKVLQRTMLMSFATSLDEIYLPLMQEVGMKWHMGEVSVAQEHFTTSFCKEKLVTMLHSLAHGSANAKDVICAGLEGEYHELGLLAISIKLAMQGYRVMYLGPNLPIDELVRMAVDHQPELICQSVVLRRTREEFEDHAGELRERVPKETTLAFGGPGLGDYADVKLEGVLVCETIEDLMAELPA